MRVGSIFLSDPQQERVPKTFNYSFNILIHKEKTFNVGWQIFSKKLFHIQQLL